MQQAQAPDIRAVYERLVSPALLAATVAYAVLIAAGLAALGTLPAAADTGSQLVVWFREHRGAVRWAAWTFTVSTLPLAMMLALLRRMIPAPYREVFLIGGIAVIVTSGVQMWFWAGLALHADQLEPAIARAVLDVAVF